MSVRLPAAALSLAAAIVLIPTSAHAERVKGQTHTVAGRLGYLPLKGLPATPGRARREEDEDPRAGKPRGGTVAGPAHGSPAGEVPGTGALTAGAAPTRPLPP